MKPEPRLSLLHPIPDATSSTAVTETVCRHEIRPALTKGATAMNRILKAKATPSA